MFMGIGAVIRSGSMAPRIESEDPDYNVVMIRPDGRFINRPAYAMDRDM